MLLSSVFLTLAACAIGLVSAAVTPHSFARRSSRHNALQPIQKRASGQFTYYAVGMGACGKQNADSDFVSNSAIFCCVLCSNAEQVVALNTPVNLSSPYPKICLWLTVALAKRLGMGAPTASRRLQSRSMALRPRPRLSTGLVLYFSTLWFLIMIAIAV